MPGWVVIVLATWAVMLLALAVLFLVLRRHEQRAARSRLELLRELPKDPP